MLASISTFALLGIDAIHVAVEVDIHTGLPAFNIVGLPDAAVRESRERVRAALRNSGFDFPLNRITVNLAPADLHKVGPSFDLAVACGLLVASGQLADRELKKFAVFGELALDGRLRPVHGALSLAAGAKQAAKSRLILPVDNVAEASLVEGVEAFGLARLSQLQSLFASDPVPSPRPVALRSAPSRHPDDLTDIRGHSHAKRALEIAAAGGHNMLMRGPPGCGKTMLARRLSGILPPLSPTEAIEVTRIHSVAGVLGNRSVVSERPFRAPHHSVSPAGLVGGDSPPRPGEISLAHNGVLFLDELAEFSRLSLEAMRQPLETGSVTVTRARGAFTFPARFMLMAATNPCPCGFAGDRQRHCICSAHALMRYRSRLSGPLLDRIDILLEMERPILQELVDDTERESSRTVRERVVAARNRQAKRLVDSGINCNAQMGIRSVKRFCPLNGGAQRILELAERKLTLGGRGYVRVLRVARTVADLADRDRIEAADLALALGYRQLEPTEGLALAAV